MESNDVLDLTPGEYLMVTSYFMNWKKYIRQMHNAENGRWGSARSNEDCRTSRSATIINMDDPNDHQNEVQQLQPEQMV